MTAITNMFLFKEELDNLFYTTDLNSWILGDIVVLVIRHNNDSN